MDMDETNAADFVEAIREYLDSGGYPCINPVCRKKGGVVAVGEFEINGSPVTRRVRCENCGWSWDDYYTLTGVSNVTPV